MKRLIFMWWWGMTVLIASQSYTVDTLNNDIGFIRQENLGYATQTQGSYLCDTGIMVIQDWVNREEREYANLYIVYLYPKENKKWSLLSPDVEYLDRAIILAFDSNKDGYYEYVIFDTDGDGNFDMELKHDPSEGVEKADAQGVMGLYCIYQKLRQS